MIKLVIGNKNYSTWSLRPWLLVDAFSLPYEEVKLSLHHEGIAARLGKYSPNARVPVLIDGETSVWDSLAICEYVNEQFLDGAAWPTDPKSRAHARSLCCEMHAGFNALRNEMPMNIRAQRSLHLSNEANNDIARIDQAWVECLQKFGPEGDYLFGTFSIADCFFAPVAMRFKTYGVPLSEQSESYAHSLRNHPSMVKWITGALAETEVVSEDEAGTDVN